MEMPEETRSCGAAFRTLILKIFRPYLATVAYAHISWNINIKRS